jgi:hypothetical protein
MLFLQVLDAIVLRDAAGGLGIVSAAKLPKKQSWYTELPGGKGAIVAVDLDNIEEHGDVALEVAYRVLRAQIVADARRKAFASLAESSSSASPPPGRVQLDADALLAKSRTVLAACDRLRRMKRNCTDAENMVRRRRSSVFVVDIVCSSKDMLLVCRVHVCTSSNFCKCASRSSFMFSTNQVAALRVDLDDLDRDLRRNLKSLDDDLVPATTGAGYAA